MAPLARTIAGFCIALLIALVAWRAHSLSRSGALAATIVGTMSMAAGWNWGCLLVIYFIASSALSRYRRDERARMTEAIVEKGGDRDAVQVVANGGVFAALALASSLGGDTRMVIATASLGALAAATADTWATEIGTLHGGRPISIRTFRRVLPGQSGGITLAGTVALCVGSAFIAILAVLLQLKLVAVVALVAGIIGAMSDSLLGATVQETRWCATCEQSTERSLHRCGTPTAHASGLEWMTNDVVNFFATIVGASSAAALLLW